MCEIVIVIELGVIDKDVLIIYWICCGCNNVTVNKMFIQVVIVINRS